MMPARQHICGLSFGTGRRLLLFWSFNTDDAQCFLKIWLLNTKSFPYVWLWDQRDVYSCIWGIAGVERWLRLTMTVLHLSGVAAVRDEWWGGWGGEIHTKLPVRWSCLKLPRLDKHHQKHISPPPHPSPSLPSSHTMPPLFLLIPHHCIIVSGRATRLVDTQSGKREQWWIAPCWCYPRW